MNTNMTGQVCTTCGTEGRHLQNHHPAREANNPSWTTPLCPTCHQPITARQHTGRVIEIDNPAWGHPLNAYAHVTGVMDVLEIITLNKGHSGALGRGFMLVARHLMRSIGLQGEVPLPVKSGMLRRNPAARFHDANEIQVIGNLAKMSVPLFSAMLGASHVLTRFCESVSEHPKLFNEWCDERAAENAEWMQSVNRKLTHDLPSAVLSGDLVAIGSTVRTTVDEIEAIADEFLEWLR